MATAKNEQSPGLRYPATLLESNQDGNTFFAHKSLRVESNGDSRDVDSVGVNKHLGRLKWKVKIWQDIKKKFESTDPSEISKLALELTPLVDHHWGNERLYPTLRKRFFENLAESEIPNLESFQSNENLLDELGDLLIFAALLEGINDYGLDVPGESGTEPPGMRRYVRDQKVYAQLVFDLIDEDLSWTPRASKSNLGSNAWRSWIANVFNQIRLFIVRNRRVFFAIAPLLDEYSPEYRQGLSLIEKHATFFIFSNLAWAFFIIRLLINSILILKHLVFTSQLSEFEAALSWDTRLRAQMVMRWQELFNDAAWFSCGIVTCFVLIGRAPIIGIYLAVAMQCYDLTIAVTRLLIEQWRLQDTKEKYLASYPQGSEEKIHQFEMDFQVRINLEYNAVLFSVFMFFLLLVCVGCTMPYFVSISPLFPVLGALTAVLITLVNVAGLRYFESQRSALYIGASIPNSTPCTLSLSQYSDGTTLSREIDPSKVDLGVFSVGFVRFKNDDGLDALWYIDKNKASESCELGDETRGRYDDIITDPKSHKPRSLFKDKLKQILEIEEIRNIPKFKSGSESNTEIDTDESHSSLFAKK